MSDCICNALFQDIVICTVHCNVSTLTGIIPGKMQPGVLQIFLGKKKTMVQFPLMADQCDQQLLVTSSLPPEALARLAKYSWAVTEQCSVSTWAGWWENVKQAHDRGGLSGGRATHSGRWTNTFWNMWNWWTVGANWSWSSGHTADTVGTVDTERAARRTTGRRRKRRERETLHWLSTNQPTLVLLRFERD